MGYRFEFPDGKVLSYVTDTTQSESYLDLIRDSDILIHECNFPDNYKELALRTGHSWTSGVAKLAEKAKVKKLLLTHFSPLDESEDPTHPEDAKTVFGNTIIAKDNMELDL